MRTALLTVVAALLLGSTAVLAGPAQATGTHHRSPGQRIIAIAKRYAGHAKYRDGGNSPKRGFDCSGYTQYVFRRAGVAHLPHNAQAQRHARHMHRIPRRKARPGDLVFYLDGGTAYHVAIYAGHHWQYAATTPGEGVRHQRVWSSDVVYATDWH